MSNILTIRFSSLGDVALTIPVIYSVAAAYPNDIFIVLTKIQFKRIFENPPSNVKIIPAHTTDKHKSMWGLWKLIKSFPKGIDKVADLHDVLRSQQICFYYRLKGKKVAVIDKGREDKRKLTRKEKKQLIPLKTSITRYKEVFEKLGFGFSLTFQSIFENTHRKFELIKPITGEKEGVWIGVAPFAKHREKTYPLHKMEEVLQNLTGNPRNKIFLLGGKEQEAEILETWEQKYPQTISIANKNLSLSEELLLMSYFDVIISMDSSNMHLASLVGTPVISIWGATHPYAGFYGYKQQAENIIQIEDLNCRPCSIFGNKPCYRGDHACMENLEPQMIIKRINQFLELHETSH